jgi:hypothetical protein
MSYNTQQTGTDLSYLAVLLLLAYVMSSAPKYYREFRQNHREIKIESVSPIQQVLKIGKYYTVDPYIRVWNRLAPSSSTSNLAVIPAPASR